MENRKAPHPHQVISHGAKYWDVSTFARPGIAKPHQTFLEGPTAIQPFTSTTYPGHELWSLNWFLKRWKSDKGKPFCAPTYDVQTLSAVNKESLLKAALNKNTRGFCRAEKIKERVSSMDPLIGDALQKKLAELKPTPLRMLRSREADNCILPWHNKPVSSFIALSYCWHAPEWKPSESLQNISENHELPISQKLWIALDLMRNSEDEAIWVDQLCIDQGNPKEKHDAIAEMDLIYGSARRVIVALEDITISRQGFRLLNRTMEKLYAAASQNAYREHKFCDEDL